MPSPGNSCASRRTIKILGFAISSGHFFHFQQRIHFLLNQKRTVVVGEHNRARRAAYSVATSISRS